MKVIEKKFYVRDRQLTIFNKRTKGTPSKKDYRTNRVLLSHQTGHLDGVFEAEDGRGR